MYGYHYSFFFYLKRKVKKKESPHFLTGVCVLRYEISPESHAINQPMPSHRHSPENPAAPNVASLAPHLIKLSAPCITFLVETGYHCTFLTD